MDASIELAGAETSEPVSRRRIWPLFRAPRQDIGIAKPLGVLAGSAPAVRSVRPRSNSTLTLRRSQQRPSARAQVAGVVPVRPKSFYPVPRSCPVPCCRRFSWEPSWRWRSMALAGRLASTAVRFASQGAYMDVQPPRRAAASELTARQEFLRCDLACVPARLCPFTNGCIRSAVRSTTSRRYEAVLDDFSAHRG
jgi:hypothetical protein